MPNELAPRRPLRTPPVLDDLADSESLESRYVGVRQAAQDDPIAEAEREVAEFEAAPQPATPAGAPERASEKTEAPQSTLGAVVRGAARGPLVAVDQTAQALLDIGTLLGNLASEAIGVPGVQKAPKVTYFESFVEKPQGFLGEFAQFGTEAALPFAGFSRALRAYRMLGAAHPIVRGMVSGALTDYFAFDPHLGRLTELVPRILPPGAAKRALDIMLKDSPDNPDAIERLKNVVDGAVLGGGFEVLNKLYRAWRVKHSARKLRAAAEKAGAVEPPKTEATAAAEGGGPALVEGASSAVGGPRATLEAAQQAQATQLGAAAREPRSTLEAAHRLFAGGEPERLLDFGEVGRKAAEARRSARLGFREGGSERGALKLDIVAALMDRAKLAVKDRNELARIGAAYIARGFRSYEEWKDVFLRGEFGDTFFTRSGASPPATFLKEMEGVKGEKLALYNLTEDIPGHPAGSTVNASILEDAGFTVPRRDVIPFETQADNAARAAIESHEAFQGSTVHLVRGNLAETDRAVVALPGSRTFDRPITAQDVTQFVADHRRVFEDPRFKDNIAVGTWVNSKDGTHEIAVSFTHPDRALIARLGKEFDQIAAFDLKTMADIPTGGSGRPKLSLEAALARIVDSGGAAAREVPSETALQGVYERSQKQYEELVGAVRAKLAATDTLMALAREGEWAGPWYNRAWTELQAQFGEDADVVARLIAALSPRHGVQQNVDEALAIYSRWKSGRDPMPTWAQPGDAWFGNIEKALKREAFDPEGSPKVHNFYLNILGDPNAVTVDGWMAELLFGRRQIKSGQYHFIASWIRQMAAQVGVTPREYQAALWVGKKVEDAITDFKVVEDVFDAEGRLVEKRIVNIKDEGFERIEALDRTIARTADEMRARGLLPPNLSSSKAAELVRLATFAEVSLGTANGLYLGENTEENAATGLMVAGLSSAVAGTVAKYFKRVFKAAPDAARAVARPEGAPAPKVTPVEPDTWSEMVRKYHEDVEAQTRGTRSVEQVQREAEELLLSGGMSVEDVKRILPGTAMNDTQAVAVVRRLVDSGMRLHNLAEQVKAGDQAAIPKMLEQLYLHSQIDPRRLGVVAESGRTLRMMQDPTLGMNRFLEQFQEVMDTGAKGLTAERVADMIAAFKTPEQMAVFARAMAKPGAWGIFFEVWINSLLSGPKTIIANATGNTIALVWGIGERALAEQFGRLHPGQGVVSGEARAMVLGMLDAHADAWKLAKMAFRLEEAQSGLGKVETRARAISAETFDATGDLGRVIDATGSVVRLPGRILLGTDEYFKALAFRMELSALGQREGSRVANSLGLKGKAWKDKANEVAAAIKSDPDKWMAVRKQAEQFAAVQTFTNATKLGGSLSRFTAEHPWMRLVLPFQRVTINLSKYSAERTPLGAVMAAWKGEIFGEAARQNPAIRDLRLAQLALGNSAMALIGWGVSNGWVTGRGPKDPNLRRMREEQGVPADSIRVPGTNRFIPFRRTEPIGMVLGLAADFAEASLDADAEGFEERAGQVGTALAVAIASNFTSRTFVKGLADVLTILVDPERGSERAIADLLGSLVPASSLVRQVEQIVDPAMREAETIVDRWREDIPGLSSSLKPRRTFFGGEKVPLSTMPFAPSKLERHPVLTEIGRVKASIPDPPKTVEGIKLTADERDFLWTQARRDLRIGGRTLEERLGEVIESSLYKSVGGERKAQLLKKWVDAYEDRAQALTIEKFPDLKASIIDARKERFRKLREPDAQPSPEPAFMRTIIRSLGR